MINRTNLIPKKTLLQFSRTVFEPLKRGECVTTLWVAGGGRRFRINHLLAEKKVLKNIFKDDYEKIIFIHVHPEEILEMSNRGYLELFLECLKREVKSKMGTELDAKSNCLQMIHKLVLLLTQKGYRLVFILNDFELLFRLQPTIFLNLESILNLNKKQVFFLFLANKNLVDEKILIPLGNFKYALLRNVIYIPLFTGPDIDELIEINRKNFNLIINPLIKQKLKDFFGGHPLLLKYSLGIMNSLDKKRLADWRFLEQTFIENVELVLAVKEICYSLTQKEKEIIQQVLHSRKITPESLKEAKYLLGTGILVKNTDGLVATFGQFFNIVFENNRSSFDLSISDITGEVIYRSSSCVDKFTPQEYSVLKLLVENKNKIVSRERIAEVLWGKDCLDRYSDWAIDKVLSVVRKNLNKIGFPSSRLITLKKRGFRLSS